jgi:hypothetical protein
MLGWRGHRHLPGGDRVSERDETAEINALIDELIDGEDDLIPAVAAEKLVSQLEETDLDLLDLWLRAGAQSFLTAKITERVRQLRAQAAAGHVKTRFSKAAKSGDSRELGVFAIRFCVDDDNTQRRVADMSGADHLYVAADYDHSGKRSMVLASFHKKVAAKVGDKKTSEVFGEEEYAAMLLSIK